MCNIEHSKYPDRLFLDFKVGRFQLSKHFSITHLCSLSVSKEYGKQLLLKKPSALDSGRVPLFVCECCADLECGALTVEVLKIDGGYSWKNFGYERFEAKGYDNSYSQSKYMERMGEIYFEKEQYNSTIQPYT